MAQAGPITPGTNYTVQGGDSLFSIAQRAYGNGADWQIIYDANKQTIGPNPNVIRIGEVLTIPTLSPKPGEIYVVKQGDTLTSIAQACLWEWQPVAVDLQCQQAGDRK